MVETISLEIDKCKSKNAASVSHFSLIKLYSFYNEQTREGPLHIPLQTLKVLKFIMYDFG